MANPVRFSSSQVEYRFAPPLHGQHTAEILAGELGLSDGEIDRLESLAATLGEAAKEASGPERSSLIGDYTRVVEALRKMKGDRPDINEAEGKMVPIDEADKILARRDNALIPLLQGMAKRLAPICAGRTAAEIQREVESEVGQLMRQVQAAL